MWSLIPLPYKLIGAGVIVAFLALGFKWWLNSHDALVAAETRSKVTDEIEARKTAEWKIRDDQLKIETAKLIAGQAELAFSRKAITQTLYDIPIKANQGKSSIPSQVFSIPDSGLDSALRAISTELGSPTIK